ncbi:MAG: CCA tRNA nucleotidyltransferase [Planctomycetes bacterium]|nr:CCA tRNA nucleotidyltransferase [Planctomycetota bacterium]
MANDRIDLRMPEPVRGLLAGLGDRARVVGGAIRDRLFGEPRVIDWDLVTTLESDAVARGFVAEEIHHDRAFGVVRGRVGKLEISIATYRRDGRYGDRRHPDSVEFIADVGEDAERRDFSINAIYADVDGAIEDPIGGCADAERRVLRVIGDARDRLAEDPLRVLRGARFAARFGLDWEPASLAAARQVARHSGSLPAARVFQELDGALARGAPSLPRELDRVGLWNGIFRSAPDVTPPLGRRLQGLSGASPELRWSAFLADFPDAGAILRDFSAPRDLRRAVEATLAGASALLDLPRAGRSERRRRLESSTLPSQIDLLRARVGAGEIEPGRLEQVLELVAHGPPARLISGADVLARGVSDGPAVRRLLDDVEARLPDDADRSRALIELDACIARSVKPGPDAGR